MKTIKLGALILVLALATSCWNYREVDELAIVLGVAVDRGERGEGYSLTAEINDVSDAENGGFKPLLLQAQGQSIFDSVRNMILRTGMRLYWAHAIVAIVSEEQAREGVLSVLDWLLRDAEVRSNVWFIVAKESKAQEIFEGQAELNENVSMKIARVMEAHLSTPKFIAKDVFQFNQELSAPGISATLPTIHLVENNGVLVPEVKGTAVFRRDKMIGWLDGPDSQLFSMIMPIKAHGLLVREITIEGEEGMVTYEVFGKSTSHNADIDDGTVVMNVELDLQVALADLDGLTLDYEDPAMLSFLENDLATGMEQGMDALINTVQQDYGSDIFGFGAAIRRQHPDIWRDLEENWGDTFSQLDVQVTVLPQIRASGLRAQSIKMRD